MPRCTRKGCGQEYAENSSGGCTYHSGTPVFHEGLKSWSCCSDVNKPVLEFDEFMKIPGCMETDRHTSDAPQMEAPKSSPNVNVTITESIAGKEVYSSGGASKQTLAPVSTPVAAPAPVVEEKDDLNISVEPGTACQRRGCGTAFVSHALNRNGDGEGTICTYHPAPPIFREGSKGYLCCKRRVLEFDEFLKIEGCKVGRHLFAPKVTNEVTAETTTCRIDHYQTLDKVHVSVFAKNVDKERSTVKFDETEVSLDLYLPQSKRFLRTLDLFGPIDVAASSFQFLGTKVELHLQKQDTRSWTVLEKTTQDLGNISLTFGVGGRTGTMGAKEIVLDETNKARA